MSDVIHASERALAIIRSRGDSGDHARADTRACDGQRESFIQDSFYAAAARVVLDGKDLKTEALLGVLHGAAWPTCPVCLVLLDAALEQRDVAALLRAVAAP